MVSKSAQRQISILRSLARKWLLVKTVTSLGCVCGYNLCFLPAPPQKPFLILKIFSLSRKPTGKWVETILPYGYVSPPQPGVSGGQPDSFSRPLFL